MNTPEHFDHHLDGSTHWIRMHRQSHLRPCFHQGLLGEFSHFIHQLLLPSGAEVSNPLRHMVLGSQSHAFNLGGDLEFFAEQIRTQNRQALLDYGMMCVKGVHLLHTHFGHPVRTIALVQGDALGGGMEMALACQLIIAEEHTKMGLPEICFGLFPGMGAYSFLCQRVPPHVAERIILSGQVWSAKELLKMGVIDMIAPTGQGEHMVKQVIKQEQRAALGHLAMGQVRRAYGNVSLAELSGVVNTWVDTALALDDKSLRMMERLVRAQEKNIEKSVEKSSSMSKDVSALETANTTNDFGGARAVA